MSIFHEKPTVAYAKVGNRYVRIEIYFWVTTFRRFVKEYWPAGAMILAIVFFTIAGGAIFNACLDGGL